MTTHTLTGFALTGSALAGTLQYVGPKTLTAIVPDDYELDFTYFTPGGTVSSNDFGIPEVDLDLTAFYQLSDGDGADDEFFVYDLNLLNGGTVRILQVYDNALNQDFIFFVSSTGAGSTALPQTEQDVNTLLALIDPNSPASLVDERADGVPGGVLSPNDFANTVSVENDVFFDAAGNNSEIDLGIGDDSAYVLDGNDTVYGGVGEDRIVATGGSNSLFGGDDNDVLKFRSDATGSIEGGEGDDKIIGAEGDDTLEGNEGSDIVIGLGGVDTLFGSIGDDFLYGGRGNDEVNGGVGSDRLRGNLNNDVLNGDDGDDFLFGGGQNDTLNGGEGRDFLLGENGNDRLDGGTGNDNLTGGAGDDEFAFFAGYGFDRVKDFTSGEDKIDLFYVTSDFTIVDYQYVLDNSTTTGSGDFRINLENGDVLYVEGVTTLAESDFLFNT